MSDPVFRLWARRAAAVVLAGSLAGAPVRAETSRSTASAVRVTDLRCEYSVDPLGIDERQPRLFWALEGSARGMKQSAYRVLVASSREKLVEDEGDLWDSGRVDSDQSTHIHYAGAPLHSSQQVFWKVRVWDQAGNASDWSEPATWTMGLLEADDWRGARWIVAPWTSEALLLRKEFNVRPALQRALLYVCGLGQYEAFCNGGRVGEDLLSPGWTDYDDTTLYDTHDITGLLREGRNALGLALGNGMYHVVRRNRFAKFTGSFGPLRAIAYLRLEYEDGSVEEVGTDESWRVARGPITYSSIYGGEDYDARLRPAGWERPGFDDHSWAHAVLLVRPAGTLRGHSFAAEPLRAIETHAPVKIRPLGPGRVLYDFGQNASFMPRLRVSGPAGSTVRMTPGEVVDENGEIDRDTMGGAERGSAWWQYTKGTDGEESWFPQFYYVGSRYLSVDLIPAEDGGARPKVESLEAVVVHSSARPVGDFATSNSRLNRIRNLVRWAQRSNMVSVLTDCPHREKLGWLEQYHLNGPSIRYEFDVARIFTKGMHDMATAQLESGLVPNIAPEYTRFRGTFRAAAAWGSAFIIVPWQQYLFSGDIDLLRRHYDAMKRYFAYLESRTEDGLLAEGLGDWYDFVLGQRGRAGLTPPPITATAFYFYDAHLLGEIARVLGRKEDARDYAARAERIRRRYNAEFFHPETGTYATGSQASLALPLALGIVEPAERPRVLAALVADLERRGYATAGDVGFRFLLRALAENGRSDVIYRFIDQDEKPGYAYQLKMGATALTESWDASRGASQNHFMLGQVIEWFYRDLAGIAPDPAAPGFANVIVRPQPVEGLDWVEASYRSIRGPVGVRWERPGARFVLNVQIPANATATVFVPTKSSDTPVTEGGSPAGAAKGVSLVEREPDRAVFQVGSGHFVFESEWEP